MVANVQVHDKITGAGADTPASLNFATYREVAMSESNSSCADESPLRQVHIGIKVDSLTVIGPGFIVSRFVRGKKRRETSYVCRCLCGRVVVRERSKLFASHVCNRNCKFKKKKDSGPTSDPLYNTWNTIKYRCRNPKCPRWSYYGGRGINVCHEWHDSFDVFRAWALQAGWKPGLHVDRIDNDGNYEPTNCRVVTASANCRNRPATKLVDAFGETKSLPDWADDPRCPVTHRILSDRLRRGWTAEDAITLPKLR